MPLSARIVTVEAQGYMPSAVQRRMEIWAAVEAFIAAVNAANTHLPGLQATINSPTASLDEYLGQSCRPEFAEALAFEIGRMANLTDAAKAHLRGFLAADQLFAGDPEFQAAVALWNSSAAVRPKPIEVRTAYSLAQATAATNGTALANCTALLSGKEFQALVNLAAVMPREPTSAERQAACPFLVQCSPANHATMFNRSNGTNTWGVDAGRVLCPDESPEWVFGPKGPKGVVISDYRPLKVDDVVSALTGKWLVETWDGNDESVVWKVLGVDVVVDEADQKQLENAEDNLARVQITKARDEVECASNSDCMRAQYNETDLARHRAVVAAPRIVHLELSLKMDGGEHNRTKRRRLDLTETGGTLTEIVSVVSQADPTIATFYATPTVPGLLVNTSDGVELVSSYMLGTSHAALATMTGKLVWDWTGEVASVVELVGRINDTDRYNVTGLGVTDKLGQRIYSDAEKRTYEVQMTMLQPIEQAPQRVIDQIRGYVAKHPYTLYQVVDVSATSDLGDKIAEFQAQRNASASELTIVDIPAGTAPGRTWHPKQIMLWDFASETAIAAFLESVDIDFFHNRILLNLLPQSAGYNAVLNVCQGVARQKWRTGNTSNVTTAAVTPAAVTPAVGLDATGTVVAKYEPPATELPFSLLAQISTAVVVVAVSVQVYRTKTDIWTWDGYKADICTPPYPASTGRKVDGGKFVWPVNSRDRPANHYAEAVATVGVTTFSFTSVNNTPTYYIIPPGLPTPTVVTTTTLTFPDSTSPTADIAVKAFRFGEIPTWVFDAKQRNYEDRFDRPIWVPRVHTRYSLIEYRSLTKLTRLLASGDDRL